MKIKAFLSFIFIAPLSGAETLLQESRMAPTVLIEAFTPTSSQRRTGRLLRRHMGGIIPLGMV